MQNPFHAPLEKLRITIEAVRPKLVHALGVEALHFIDDNFAKQGFQGAAFQKWPDRKKKEKGRQRSILVKTGTLRRSFVQTDHSDHTVISSDIPYAKVHNEGGDIEMPARQTILNFNQRKTGKLRLASVRTEGQQRKVAQIRRASVSGYSIHMPQRRFIGPSPVLTQRCQYSLVRIIKENIK